MDAAVSIRTRPRFTVAFAALLALLVTAIAHAGVGVPQVNPASIDPALTGASGLVRVIVQATPGTEAATARAVAGLGGSIARPLPIVHGFSATVPASAIADMARITAIRSISLDAHVKIFEASPDSSQLRSLHPQVVRADKVWDAGITGRGTTVALVDTGVADVPDLAGRVKTITDDLTGATSSCVNMTSDTDCGDYYGHGTFMAGIIAGNGAGSNGRWKGIAPEASIVALKVAGRDGGADVSTVLAAIQWVVSFKDRYGIRVMNLSLGTNSTQTYRTDPLNYAVERAWDAGIVVIVSASNLGPDPRTIAKPGDDPWVITVGATDDNGTVRLNDDSVPDFSSRGPTAADGLSKPDVAAPGGHIVSLRAPGSLIDTAFPGTSFETWYRKGSGTSMSAAVASGVAALMVQANPTITPNRVKYALVSTARAAASANPYEVGAGEIDVEAAINSAPPGLANQGLDRSSGMGSLDLSRGSVQVQTDDPLQSIIGLTLTAQMLMFNPYLYTSTAWTGLGWYDAQWYGAKWYGAKWYGAKWYGAKWYGAKWYENADPQPESYGSPLPGGAWLGAWE